MPHVTSLNRAEFKAWMAATGRRPLGSDHYATEPEYAEFLAYRLEQQAGRDDLDAIAKEKGIS